MNDKNDRYVFVYGTLKQNYSNHGRLNGANFFAHGLTVAKFRMWGSSFPLTKFDGEGYQVIGEVYKVSDHHIADMDRLEGYPGFYDRMPVAVKLPDEKIIHPWMYYIPVERAHKTHHVGTSPTEFYPPNENGFLEWPDCRNAWQKRLDVA